jgi:GT2 family glycosyltransferase/glycosyltransferase involved in cell wall biosynthesis
MKSKAGIESRGLLILGMHRSGTSALTNVLRHGGADVGSRVLGASAGNQTGHWEDALAVEIHERLLASFGARWDEPFALPAGWEQGEAATEARASIRGYLESNRSKLALWVVKDPRLCLFASLWCQAAAELEMPLGTVVVLRHPLEVAQSLLARDGIAPGRGMLLWLEYTLAAMREAEQVPHVLIEYSRLLADWRDCVLKIQGLPGCGELAYDDVAAAEVDNFLDRNLRHHSASEASGLPRVVSEVWTTLSGFAAEGALPGDASATAERSLLDVREFLRPVMGEARTDFRLLWERMTRAEAQVVDLAAAATNVPAGLAELRASMEIHQADLRDIVAGRISKREAELAERESYRDQELLALREVEQQVQLLAAECDRRRRAMATLQAECLRLRHLAEEFEQVTTSNSWRWTRPFRFARRLFSGQLAPSDGSRLRGIARRLIMRMPWLSRNVRSNLIAKTLSAQDQQRVDLPDAAMAPMLKIATRKAEIPDIFVWSVIDWHSRTQRPQHLASAMAEKGHRVFYISVDFIDNPQAGYRIDPLNDRGNLFQVHLHLAGFPLIYSAMPSVPQIDMLKASLGELLAWTHTQQGISLIQHPYWSELARSVPGALVVYDCLDHHAGFENNSTSVLEKENELVSGSDLVVVTSAWLEGEFRDRARAIALIRNACEYDFFSRVPEGIFRDQQGRKVVGYYGAIADWFDVALVRRVASANPQSMVVLVGRDEIGASETLADLENVQMVGEVPYGQLPYWLHGFDVCLLPFKVVPLTVATNPVKIYEYLAAGKPVVAVDLPEMSQFGDLIHIASHDDDFIAAVGASLNSPSDASMSRRRQEFAAGQTWLHRAETLDQAIRDVDEALVSVVVLTYNNLEHTRTCLSSIEACSDYRNLEIIIVDNASTDGSVEFLTAWMNEPSPAGHRRRLIRNDTNRGFAAGNNAGLAAASGEFLVLLNNDTHVTPGWVRTLCNHLRRDGKLGLIGPVTNNIGNEARIQIVYSDMSQMIQVAGKYTRRHPGVSRPMETVAFFCVALPRRVYESIGGLDEAFGQGFFEDDDYCRRVRSAGWSIACAEDVFVHHHLSASFDQVDPSTRAALFAKNKAIYEDKWGPWPPHAYRDE